MMHVRKSMVDRVYEAYCASRERREVEKDYFAMLRYHEAIGRGDDFGVSLTVDIPKFGSTRVFIVRNEVALRYAKTVEQLIPVKVPEFSEFNFASPRAFCSSAPDTRGYVLVGDEFMNLKPDAQLRIVIKMAVYLRLGAVNNHHRITISAERFNSFECLVDRIVWDTLKDGDYHVQINEGTPDYLVPKFCRERLSVHNHNTYAQKAVR